MEYIATINGEDHRIFVEIDFHELAWRYIIDCNVEVFEDGRWVNISKSLQLGKFTGPQQIFVSGFYDPHINELHIENVQRGILNPGQRFLEKIISKIRMSEKCLTSIYLANIKHKKTYDLLMELNSKNLKISLSHMKECKPLLFSLAQCGFENQEIIVESSSCFSVRASIKN